MSNYNHSTYLGNGGMFTRHSKGQSIVTIGPLEIDLGFGIKQLSNDVVAAFSTHACGEGATKTRNVSDL